MEIIGIRAVSEALKADGKKIRLIVQDKKAPKLREILDLAYDQGIEVREDRNYFYKFKSSHQGVCLEVPEYEYMDLDEFLRRPKEDRKAIVALDGVEDVGNFGSIIRSASVFGISAIIITKDRSAHITPAVIKTAQGGLEDLPIIMVVNLSRALRDLKDAGYFILGTDMEGDDVGEVFDSDVVMVIGSEHSGMRPGVKKECDKILTIPMDKKSSVGSLNAAVAASIVFYEYHKKQI